MKHRRVRTAFVGAGVLAFLAGCGGGSDNAGSGTASQTRAYKTLQFTLTTPKTVYARGENVPMTWTVTNNGTTPVVMDFASCNRVYGMVTQGANTVWRASPAGGQGCPTSDRTYSLSAGASISFTLYWSQSDSQNVSVSTGAYTLQATSGGNPIDGVQVPADQITTPPLQITVK